MKLYGIDIDLREFEPDDDVLEHVSLKSMRPPTRLTDPDRDLQIKLVGAPGTSYSLNCIARRILC